MEEEAISFREFGRRYGMSDAPIRFYIKKGYLTSKSLRKNPKNKRPCIIESLAVEELRANFKEDWGQDSVPSPPKQSPVESKNQADMVSDKKGNKDVKKITALTEVNLEIAKVKLMAETLELRKKEGELVSYVDVQRALFEKGQQVKVTMQSLPAKYIDEIMAAAMDGRNQAVEVLSKAINACLFQLGDISEFKIKR